MEPVLSFIVAVAAGVACHYIIKWLDGDKKSVTSLWFKPPYKKRNRKAQGIALPGLFVLRLQYWCFLFA